MLTAREPIYTFVKGKGWIVASAVRSAEDIEGGYTYEKNMARSGFRCTTCQQTYAMHNGDACDFPYNGREWTDR